MAHPICRRLWLLAGMLVVLLAIPVLATAQITQTLELQAGWNAVYITVQPDPRKPADVFAPIIDSVESVWTYFHDGDAVEFIVDPAEEEWNTAGWHSFFPEGRQPAYLTNLYAIFANRAFLIRMREAKTLTLTGEPSATPVDWAADSYNFTGLNVDPGNPPTFAKYFAGSPAHAGQPVYRLGAGGEWQRIENLDEAQVKTGEAYWIYCDGASEFQGALYYILPMHDGLRFGDTLPELGVTIVNASDMARNLVFNYDSGTIPLAYRFYDAGSGRYQWGDLQSMPAEMIEAGDRINRYFAIRRELMEPGEHEAVLEITDNQGFRALVPVTARKDG